MFSKQRPDKKSKIILDYVTVSYREIIGIVLVAAIGIGAGVGIWYVYYRQTDPAQLAQTEIKAAERSLSRASSVLTPDREDLQEVLSRASDELGAAREYLRRREYDRAISSATACQGLASEVYQAIEGEAMYAAVLSDIAGHVDYQRQNSQTWMPASNGLELYPGDKVRTLQRSGARLRDPSGVVSTMEENAVIIVPEPSIDTRTGRPESRVVVQRGVLTMESPENAVSRIETPEAEARLPGPGALRGGRDERSERTEFSVTGSEATIRTNTGEEVTLRPERGVTVDRTGVGEIFEWIRAPKLLSPTDGKVFLIDDLQGQTIPLEWDSVPNAAGYRLQISRLNVFTGNIHYEQELDANRAIIRSPQYGSWWWRVISLSEDGRRSIAPVAWSFRVRKKDRVTGSGPSISVKPVMPIGRKVLVEGTTDPGTLLTYSVNGSQEISMSVDATGAFREFVTLTRPGLNEILLRGQTPSGASTEEKIPVRYETY